MNYIKCKGHNNDIPHSKIIKIVDWCGNILFSGGYDDKEVDQILDANRCSCKQGCAKCNNTGYSGDFEVMWVDQWVYCSCNVYEYINY